MTYFKQKIELKYMLKILTGIFILSLSIILTFFSSSINLNHWLVVGFPIVIFGLLPLYTYFIYSKMDELEQKLHKDACTVSFPLLISLVAVIGVLQANNILPLFNLVWVFMGTIVMWSLLLVFNDYIYK